jgi:nicotinamidase-related amidase
MSQLNRRNLLLGSAGVVGLSLVKSVCNSADETSEGLDRRFSRMAYSAPIKKNGAEFAEGEPGWEFLDSLDIQTADCIVAKTICDSFYGTKLKEILEQNGVDELFIVGWATDFCVDTTVRSAGSREYTITVVGDAHTAADREHLSGQVIIQHHNAVWSAMDVAKSPIRVASAAEVIDILSK